jgi:hypothetical protein
MAKIQIANLSSKNQIQKLNSEIQQKIHGGDVVVFYANGTAKVFTCGGPDVTISYDPRFPAN